MKNLQGQTWIHPLLHVYSINFASCGIGLNEYLQTEDNTGTAVTESGSESSTIVIRSYNTPE